MRHLRKRHGQSSWTVFISHSISELKSCQVINIIILNGLKYEEVYQISKACSSQAQKLNNPFCSCITSDLLLVRTAPRSSRLTLQDRRIGPRGAFIPLVNLGALGRHLSSFPSRWLPRHRPLWGLETARSTGEKTTQPWVSDPPLRPAGCRTWHRPSPWPDRVCSGSSKPLGLDLQCASCGPCLPSCGKSPKLVYREFPIFHTWSNSSPPAIPRVIPAQTGCFQQEPC